MWGDIIVIGKINIISSGALFSLFSLSLSLSLSPQKKKKKKKKKKKRGVLRSARARVAKKESLIVV